MARIIYCTPGLGPCGGVRVLVEHCNRLAARGHTVGLVAPKQQQPGWIDVQVPILPLDFAMKPKKPFDVVVATGFQTVQWALQIPAQRRYYFVQMMEHEFFKANSPHWTQARGTYELARDNGIHVITIAEWLRDTLQEEWGIAADIVPNGVNQGHFYPVGDKKHAILVEGDNRNPAKDVDHVSWRVALELRERYGVELWGYSALGHPFVDQMDLHIKVPTTAQMRRMYSEALFLLKASKYEGRACAPVEAMCCGTTSARAIVNGDDDLVNGDNCLRTAYDYDELLWAACSLMDAPALRQRLERNCLQYAKTRLQWDTVVDQLEAIYQLRG